MLDELLQDLITIFETNSAHHKPLSHGGHAGAAVAAHRGRQASQGETGGAATRHRGSFFFAELAHALFGGRVPAIAGVAVPLIIADQ